MSQISRHLSRTALAASLSLGLLVPATAVSAQAVPPALPSGEASSYEATVLASRPVAYWPLSDGPGTSVRDAAGYSTGLVEGGATVGETAGPFAGSTALLVDGEPCSGVDVGSAAGVVTTPDVTVETWVRTESDREKGIIFRRRFAGYSLEAGTQGVVLGGSFAGGVSSPVDITDGRWHHLAGTLESGRTARLYVDGVLVGEKPLGSLSAWGSEVAIGRDGNACDGVVTSFVGGISHVAVYDRALTTSEISARTAPREAPLRYVALGDSFHSGEGASPFAPGTDTGQNQCHRSERAGAVLFANDPGAGRRPLDLHHVACSGARLFNLKEGQYNEAPQYDAVTPDTAVVTISIGGNDAGFVPLLEACGSFGLIGVPCERHVQAGVRRLFALLDTPQPRLENRTPLEHAYVTIKERVPQARILVMGYPRIFPERPTGKGVLKSETSCGTFAAWDQRFLNKLVDEANAIIKRRSEEVGLTFVDLVGPFTGHGVCDRQPFINGVRLGTNGADQQKPGVSPESFHPNPDGQRAIADALRAAY